MSSALVSLEMWGLRKGAFYDRHPLEIPEGGAYDMRNVIGVYGTLRPRPGLVTAYPTPYTEAIGLLHLFKGDHSNAPVPFRLGRSGNNVRPRRWNGSSWGVPGGGPTSWNVTTHYRRRTFNGVEYLGEYHFTGGPLDTGLLAFTGSTLSDPASGQNPQQRGFKRPEFVGALADRIVVANAHNQADEPVRNVVAWSDMLRPKVWRNELTDDSPFGSAGYAFLGDDSPITGLYCSGGTIWAFKSQSIFIGEFVGPPLTFEFRQEVSGTGCIANETIQSYKDGKILWLGDDDVYMGVLGQAPQPIGGPVVPLIRAVSENVSDFEMSQTLGVIDRERQLYHLIFPGIPLEPPPEPEEGEDPPPPVEPTGTRLLLTYNLLDNSWWRGSLPPAVRATKAISTRLQNWDYQILIGTATGQILDFSFEHTDDLGAPFPSWWQSGILSVARYFPGETNQASLQQLRAFASQGRVRLSAIHGNGLDRFQTRDFGSQIFDGVDSLDRTNRPYKAEHAMVRVEWEDPSTRVAGVAVGIIPGGKVRGRR